MNIRKTSKTSSIEFICQGSASQLKFIAGHNRYSLYNE